MINRSTDAGRQIDRLFRLGTVGTMTDAQLLEQFVTADDEAAALAFEAIVERYGAMVLRVCRTLLRDEHAAEDAFQATFLVLARKARTIDTRELLSNWLYGVASRTAQKGKSDRHQTANPRPTGSRQPVCRGRRIPSRRKPA